MNKMKKAIFLITILFGIVLFAFAVKSPASAACNNWNCTTGYGSCDPTKGTCSSVCTCMDNWPEDKDESYYCGPSQYSCNRDSDCCNVGSGDVVPTKKTTTPKDYHYGPDCPRGYVVDTTDLRSTWCTGYGGPPAWREWWTPKRDRYVLGSSQVEGNCCSSKETGGDNCKWEACPTRNKPNKICKRCDPVHVVCTATYTYNYACKPIVPPTPPVVVTNTLQNNGDTMGCSAAAGYAGKVANNTVRMSVTTPTTYSGGTVIDVRAWFGGSALLSESLKADGTPQALSANGSFGILVRKVGTEWTDVFAPSKYATVTGNAGPALQSWVKIGTVASGGVIRGADGKPLADIRNISVASAGANTTLAFNLSFYSDMSGQQIYETAVSKAYALNGAARYSNTSGNTSWVASTSTFTLDLIAPTVESVSTGLVDEDTIDLTWRFSDANGLLRTIGNADIEREGDSNGPIDRISPTPATLGYVLGSVSEDTIFNSTNSLWRIDGTTANRVERINMGSNVGGALEFYIHAFDRACNNTRGSLVVSLGDPWLVTKAGVAYTAGGSSMSVIDLLSSSPTEKISDDSYWNLPYAMYKADADLSTEVVGTRSESLYDLINSVTLKSVRVTGKDDSNNKDGYWYNKLVSKSAKEVKETPAEYVEVSLAGATVTLSNNSTSIADGSNTCVNSKNCIVHVPNNLVIEEGYSCNARTLFLVAGTVTINPDVTADNVSHGCMFVSKGNVNITKGTYKSGSSTYPKYDLLEAFIISDGIITIEAEDQAAAPRDGIKITGGLMAFGRTGSRSIELLRKLTLVDANAYPSAAIHFDYRYLNFAVPFFGGSEEVFKQEVGFKPL